MIEYAAGAVVLWFIFGKGPRFKRRVLKPVRRQSLGWMTPATDEDDAVQQLQKVERTWGKKIYFYEADLTSFTRPHYLGAPPVVVMHRILLFLRDAGIGFGVLFDHPVTLTGTCGFFVESTGRDNAVGIRVHIWMQGETLCVRMQPFGMCPGRIDEISMRRFTTSIQNSARLLHSSILQSIEATTPELM